ATRIGVASLPQRWGASSVIVVGIAGVVGVLVAMLAMGEGFQATLNNTGDDTTAIVLRGGSQAETNSVITREQVPTLSTLPGISRDAQGRPLLSPELSQVVNLVSKSDGTDVNAQFRGVGPQAWAVHDKVKIIEGRKFAPGLREIVV
ncbi:ABC transporter permease, partial [Escherichia coli]